MHGETRRDCDGIARDPRCSRDLRAPSQCVPGRLPRLIVNVHPRRYLKIVPFRTNRCNGGCDAVFRFEIYGDE